MSTTVDTNSPPAAGEDVELDAIPAELQPEVLRAAQAIADADAILFTSGAGLGVDRCVAVCRISFVHCFFYAAACPTFEGQKDFGKLIRPSKSWASSLRKCQRRIGLKPIPRERRERRSNFKMALCTRFAYGFWFHRWDLYTKTKGFYWKFFFHFSIFFSIFFLQNTLDMKS